MESKYKIVLIGNSSVGKTAIIHKYLLQLDYSDSYATIGASFHSVNYGSINLQVWDTAGGEMYKALSPIYYKNSHAALCVFDVTNRKSFIDVNNWITIFKNHTDHKSPIIIIGNKIDYPQSEHKMTLLEIEELAKIHQCDYLLTSAKTGANEKAFQLTMNNLCSKFTPNYISTNILNLESSSQSSSCNKCY